MLKGVTSIWGSKLSPSYTSNQNKTKQTHQQQRKTSQSTSIGVLGLAPATKYLQVRSSFWLSLSSGSSL
ncbi:MAG: hypothetical protein OIF58_11650, partial [Cohaesibacter sp.]|nr:hypothetical protein [Cohaesibacter sp.]